ncbi:hypothetical protein [Streptomyces mirabilis]
MTGARPRAARRAHFTEIVITTGLTVLIVGAFAIAFYTVITE